MPLFGRSDLECRRELLEDWVEDPESFEEYLNELERLLRRSSDSAGFIDSVIDRSAQKKLIRYQKSVLIMAIQEIDMAFDIIHRRIRLDLAVARETPSADTTGRQLLFLLLMKLRFKWNVCWLKLEVQGGSLSLSSRRVLQFLDSVRVLRFPSNAR